MSTSPLSPVVPVDAIAAAVGNSEESKRLHQLRDNSPAAASTGGAMEQFNEEMRATAGFNRRCGTFSAVLGASAAAAVLSWRRTHSGLSHLYPAQQQQQQLGFLQRYLITPLLLPAALGIGFVIMRSVWFERELRSRECARELWELQNYRDGEISEMVEIYQSKGLAESQAKSLVDILASNDSLLVSAMMTDELGFSPLEPPSFGESAQTAALSVCSFLGAAILPLAAAHKFDRRGKCSWVPEVVLAVISLAVSILQSNMLLRTYSDKQHRRSSMVSNCGFISALYSVVQLACATRL